MFQIHSSETALWFCVVTMLGWGSWANTLKASSDRGWSFALYYWDYVLGLVFFAFVVALTLGSHGSSGTDVWQSLRMASSSARDSALLSGALFNISNILIVIATDLAGIAVAFPVAVGLAVILGTLFTYWQDPSGNAGLLFAGVGMILCAMLLSAAATSKRGAAAQKSLRGLGFAVLAGTVMGFFYPRLAASIAFTRSGTVHKLTPYAAALLFVFGVLLSNILANTILLRLEHVSYSRYFRGSLKSHAFGFVGGLVWMTALTANLIAAPVAGAAESYALGQGATLVAALWGVFIWREFGGCGPGVKRLLGLMFASYVAGLTLIGAASL